MESTTTRCMLWRSLMVCVMQDVHSANGVFFILSFVDCKGTAMGDKASRKWCGRGRGGRCT